MTPGPTRSLAEWIARVDVDAAPPAVGAKARSCLLDVFACAGAGAAGEPMRALRRAMLAGDSDGPGMPWFGSDRTSIWTEAFVNAACVHALDYDDSHRGSKTHPGAPVVPAVLAAARERVDLADVFAGVVAGYEVTMRLGSAVGVAEHRRNGWHATATCGVIGAAAGVSRTLRLDPARVASALGNAATQAAGIWAFSTDGAMSKKFHPGHAARAGLGAAYLARAGVTGSAVSLEAADGGFFASFAPDRPAELWRRELAEIGAPYRLPEVAQKPYPCCRTAHTAIDAARRLRASGLRGDDVERVTVGTYRVGVDQCGFHDPANGTQAAFSTPYLVACALQDGWIGPEHFTEEAVADPDRRELHRRVTVGVDDELDAQFPLVWPARLRIALRSGGSVECRVDVALGDPAVPMSPRQVEAKLTGCLSRDGDAAPVTELSRRLLSLPATGPAEELTALLDDWPG